DVEQHLAVYEHTRKAGQIDRSGNQGQCHLAVGELSWATSKALSDEGVADDPDSGTGGVYGDGLPISRERRCQRPGHQEVAVTEQPQRLTGDEVDRGVEAAGRIDQASTGLGDEG